MYIKEINNKMSYGICPDIWFSYPAEDGSLRTGCFSCQSKIWKSENRYFISVSNNTQEIKLPPNRLAFLVWWLVRTPYILDMILANKYSTKRGDPIRVRDVNHPSVQDQYIMGLFDVNNIYTNFINYNARPLILYSIYAMLTVDNKVIPSRVSRLLEYTKVVNEVLNTDRKLIGRLEDYSGHTIEPLTKEDVFSGEWIPPAVERMCKLRGERLW